MQKIMAVLFILVLLSGCGDSTQNRDSGSTIVISESSGDVQGKTEQKTSEAAENTEMKQSLGEKTADTTKQALQTNIDDAETPQSNQQKDNQNDSAKNAEQDDYYMVCTNYSKSEVEAFAAKIKNLFLDKDWEQLADMAAYPITVHGNTYQSREEFAKGNFASEIGDEFYSEITNADTVNMACNSHGIMIGSGQIWFSEVINAENGQGELKIIGINF